MWGLKKKELIQLNKMLSELVKHDWLDSDNYINYTENVLIWKKYKNKLIYK